jgi:hypothetical protein
LRTAQSAEDQDSRMPGPTERTTFILLYLGPVRSLPTNKLGDEDTLPHPRLEILRTETGRGEPVTTGINT